MIRSGYYIQGLVQGVGFRPFVYKLAHELNLAGFVKNSIEGVELEIQGDEKNITLFEEYLHSKLPPLARIDNIEKSLTEIKNEKSFEILQSTEDSSVSKTALIPPDIAICKDCLKDIESEEKYLDYFATNCTNCGPRYSIIKTVPYDRANTSMKKFTMCPSCQDEYTDPLNRRYHAQPVSVNSCGPTLTETIESASEQIKNGAIVCVKGLGGFHIVCDSTNDEVVAKLREFKNRPTKPFAIMCKNIEQVKSLVNDSKFVSNNTSLHNFDILSHSGNNSTINDIIKGKNSVIYFWSTEFMSSDYLVNRIKYLEKNIYEIKNNYDTLEQKKIKIILT